MNALTVLFLAVIISTTACQQGIQATTASNDENKSEQTHVMITVRQLAFEHCQANEHAGLQLIQNADEWQAINRQPDVIGRHANNPADSQSAINFDTHFGLLVTAAYRPTPGYALHLVSTETNIDAELITIEFTMTSPPTEAIMAQVLSYPCTVVELPKAEFNRIQVKIAGDKNESLSIAVP
ncbi:MAG: protease complex subunit PrcB family protein [Gammaproteobacteria bacterium]